MADPERGRVGGRPWPALDLHFPAPCPADLADLAQAVLLDVRPIAIEEFPPPALPSATWSDAPPSIDAAAPERWRLVFRDAAERDRARDLLETTLAGRGVRSESFDVPDENWAARSQADLKAVQVGNIIVCPPWDVPDQASAQFPAPNTQRPAPSAQHPGPGVIIIKPSMGFGTGHHATTRLCLRALQALELAGRTVLDLGTGSGVLALAAARLGAAGVFAVDYDPDALANARENAALNHLTGIRFEKIDLQGHDVPAADIVTANLTGAVLVSRAAAIVRAVRPGGHLIISGFMEADAIDVIRSLVPPLRVFRSFEEDGWMAVLLDA